jgi:hypothetical protein
MVQGIKTEVQATSQEKPIRNLVTGWVMSGVEVA